MQERRNQRGVHCEISGESYFYAFKKYIYLCEEGIHDQVKEATEELIADEDSSEKVAQNESTSELTRIIPDFRSRKN